MSHHAFNSEHLFLTRRQMLSRCGMGMAAVALNGVPGLVAAAEGSDPGLGLNPLAPRRPQFPGKAKAVIHLFMNGGPSHLDTFDPKPELTKLHGQELPKMLKTERPTGAAFKSPFKFTKRGRCGLEVSDLFPQLGSMADELCVIRSMHADVPNHEPSLLLMNCGDGRLVRPAMGSWVTYGLGSENQNLPGFVAMCPGGYPIQETQNWQSAFLPGAFQGTYVDTRHSDPKKLVEHIERRMGDSEQRRQLDLLRALNEDHQKQRSHDARLEARLQSFELAYRMQMEASEAFDISKEPEEIRKMYGSGTQARQMLITRRLVERGVRFVQIFHRGWECIETNKRGSQKAAVAHIHICCRKSTCKQVGPIFEVVIQYFNCLFQSTRF